MFAQRQTYLEKALHSAVAVLLLLTTAGQSAVVTDNLQTTATPLLSNASLTTELNNSSMDEPLVLRSHRSCGSEHENYCENGGECMYPQDSDKPFCICTSSYSGTRCLFFSDHTYSLPELEQLIGISFGVVMLIIILAIMIYCFAQRRCIKSPPLIKSAPSKTSV
ncbi:epigen [Seriola lalandi dorsalis]|uniref:epigen n=1 Tax=Seriola lalandi dorsalis TaxID=1841481 RepID=UPI000C6F8680|nr:epigen [Seriola lalandi dorsalis]XP_056232802.1 epigen [Seriola aureovittata]